MAIKFSSLTVTYNEDTHLNECLDSLGFCAEKIVIDLGSHDSSTKIAKKYGAIIHYWERKRIIEEIKAEAIKLAKNDWIIFLDPDEVFPEDKINLVRKIISKDQSLGAVVVTVVNYFLGQRIKYGRWRPFLHDGRIINKQAVTFSPRVHEGIRFQPGYNTIDMPDIVIKHYWVDSMEEFYAKHNRYLEYEGLARFNQNQRFSNGRMIRLLINNFFYNYIIQKGFFDRRNGWQLQKLSLWYEYNSWQALRNYERNSKI